jgi:cobaltochelatase CobN
MSMAPPPPQPAAPLISGMQLEKVTAPVVQALSAMLMLALGLLVMTPAVGAWRQWRRA